MIGLYAAIPALVLRWVDALIGDSSTDAEEPGTPDDAAEQQERHVEAPG